MPLVGAWARDNDSFFTTEATVFDSRFRLVVERLPCTGWDWVVWDDQATAPCLYGVGTSALGAMRAAETAVKLLGRQLMACPAANRNGKPLISAASRAN